MTTTMLPANNNWTFEHDDHSPFGTDEDINQTEYRSLIITILFFLIGLLGNGLMLIGNGYILRNSFDGTKRTFENFLLEISCFDFIVLIYHLINSILRYQSLSNSHANTMTGLINISTVCCKLLTYIIRIATLMSHWLILLLLLNRLFLVYPKFARLTTIINAKYAVLALLFLFTLFNVPPIESMSFNEPLGMMFNSTSNTSFQRYCLMNAEMIDLHASIYSTAVIVNVFFYTGIGLIFPTMFIGILSILLFRKGANLWNEFRSHQSATENISLQSTSPIVDYLRTYNAAFTLGIVFVILSTPCKLLRLIVLFTSHNLDDFASTNEKVLIHAHTQMQTIGHAFELSLYSYKCYICLCTYHRFRCALRYFFTKQRTETILGSNHRRSTIETYYGNKRSQDSSVPFEALYKHEFEPTINMYRTNTTGGLYSHRSSFKTRSSVSSRRTKEDEISL